MRLAVAAACSSESSAGICSRDGCSSGALPWAGENCHRVGRSLILASSDDTVPKTTRPPTLKLSVKLAMAPASRTAVCAVYRRN